MKINARAAANSPINERMPNLNRISGFTLLELLVVVGILAALVALALPFYQDYVNQSKLTAAEADIKTFTKALAMYDQLEPQMFNASNFLPLIGKYLQDYRNTSNQLMPVDPWSNDYNFDVQTGAVWSSGPNGTDESAGLRNAGGDDILQTWKPDFFVIAARKINSRTLEISFSRKVSALAPADVSVPAPVGAATNIQKISDSVFRALFGADLPVSGTVTVANTVTAQDGRALSASTKPDGSVSNTATF
ncbi:MAG: hypothetical protein Kow0029_11990 [Candidatus Rifleibacteriota bacterium]